MQNDQRTPARMSPFLFGFLSALVVLVAGFLLALSAMNRRGIDRSYHYRFEARYEYLGTPVQFDIVVGCAVQITDSSLAGKSNLTGIAPFVYGLRMANGKAVVMRVPEACNGATTANGKVSQALMPFVVVYDDADKPMFGWGYATEDAYQSPRSELKFFGASMAPASKEEFLAWRRDEASKNVVKREMLNSYNKGLNPGHWYFGDNCQGYAKLKLPKGVQHAIRPYWPDAQPQYWGPVREDGKAEIEKFLRDLPLRPGEYDDASGRRDILHYGRYGVGRGIAREPTASIEDSWQQLQPEIFPRISSYTVNKLYVDGIRSLEALPDAMLSDILNDTSRKGFLFCDSATQQALTPFNKLDAKRRTFVTHLRIDGATFWNLADADGGLWFERDQHAYIFQQTWLGNPDGGL